MLLKVWMWSVLTVCLTSGYPAEYDIQDPGHYLNSFLVRVSSPEEAELVAKQHGFQYVEKLPELRDLYHFSHNDVSRRSKRSADDYINKLKQDSRVSLVEQQITLKRVKKTHEVIHDKQLELPIKEIKDNSKYYRVLPQFESRGSSDLPYNDEYYGDQWYIRNVKQSGGTEGVDMNMLKCYEMGFTGRGVVVSVLDDGVDHTHKDLQRNYDPKASADLNANDKDPTPDKTTTSNSHGTRCAGEIAAEANNGICGIGIAYDASIGGVRMLDGKVTDILEAKALIFNMNHVDIYSASWGPKDCGCVMEGLKPASVDAMKVGVEKGRNGLGNIYVWATGNGGDNCDHCGADGYVGSIYSISVNSMSDKGELPYFGERCSSTMAAVPSGGEPTKEQEVANITKIKVVTTDINNGCIENFEGTSSACPLGAGCLSVLLQAAPLLTWRDVQHIVAMYARVPGFDNSWIINGANYHVNSQFGFGLMDCAAMVEGGQRWTKVPPQHTCETEVFTVEKTVPRSGCSKVKIEFDGCKDEPDKQITHLEHVEVTVELTAPRRGDIEIFITSPAGTRSELLGRRCNDDSTEGINFKFMTVHSWMENPVGVWSLEVCHNPGTNHGRDHSRKEDIKLNKYSLITYGFRSNKKNIMKKAYSPSKDNLKNIINRELVRGREVNIKRASSDEKKGGQNQEKSDLTLKNLKELFNSLGNAFGANEEEKKSFSTREPNRKAIKSKGDAVFSRGNDLDKSDSQIDDDLEEAINDVLLDLNGRDASSIYLRSLLVNERRELRRNRLRKKLMTQLKRILTK